MRFNSTVVRLEIEALKAHFRSCEVMLSPAHSCKDQARPAVAATDCVKSPWLHKMDLSPRLSVEFTKLKNCGQAPLFCQALTNPAHFPAGIPAAGLEVTFRVFWRLGFVV